jgi:hypothetical protein
VHGDHLIPTIHCRIVRLRINVPAKRAGQTAVP